MESKAHILVVDDDDRLRALLKKFLREQGFLVTAVADAAEARRKLTWFAFDMAVFDVMMPGETGIELLASLKQSTMPVLMLSAMGEGEDRILGLETGAEDYLVKPFEPKELVLRIKTILRRSQEQKTNARSVTFGDFRFDLGNNQLRRGQEHIALTSSEAAILKLLAEHAGNPVSRDIISAAMPGSANERAVDVQITRLRKKIGEAKPVHLQTVRGAGYVLYAKGNGT